LERNQQKLFKPDKVTWNEFVKLLKVAYEEYAGLSSQALGRKASALDHFAANLPSGRILNRVALRGVIPAPPQGDLTKDGAAKVLLHLLQYDGRVNGKSHGLKWLDYVQLLGIAYESYAPALGRRIESAASALDNFWKKAKTAGSELDDSGEEVETVAGASDYSADEDTTLIIAGGESDTVKRANKYIKDWANRLDELWGMYLESIPAGQEPTKESITLYFF
jgi:hypothetical protein